MSQAAPFLIRSRPIEMLDSYFLFGFQESGVGPFLMLAFDLRMLFFSHPLDPVCGNFSGSQDVARDLNCLQSNGVTHVINLVSNIVPNLYPHLFDYLSLVLYDDMHFPLGDSIRQCVNYLERVRRAGGVCFVHCDVGRCRAPSMVIAYLIKIEDYSYERAYTEVNNARNVAINLNFKMQLMSLA
ncbi:dual specificity phosphatase, catalytic domain protein [Opisthorchis viverrini]|uniref:Dual specificity phosphatase, catalytic domain protein n=1 Tax=Opisthorchis viverrini TaxID=6198 RepID=A0A1S8WMA6_OPIVI|nr:dual specificity phosphatase, catalytic domain protein [Opisthorchis viverrini]